MTISELYKQEKLNSRLYNICQKNNLLDIDNIKEYYLRHKTFSKLKNCGKKSNKELIELYLNFRNHPDNQQPNSFKQETCLKIILQQFTEPQQKAVNKFIQIAFICLSPKSQKSLILNFGKSLDIDGFVDNILTTSFNVYNLNNVGNKTISEINSLIDKTLQFITIVSKTKTEKELEAVEFKFLCENFHPISALPENILNSKSIFKVTQFVLENDLIYPSKQNIVFQKTCKIYSYATEYCLEELALQLNTTIERVRHLRRVSLEKLMDNLFFVKCINDQLHRYKINVDNKRIVVDDMLVRRINKVSDTEFSKEFMTLILLSFLADDFELSESEDNHSLKRMLSLPQGQTNRNFYLIRKL